MKLGNKSHELRRVSWLKDLLWKFDIACDQVLDLVSISQTADDLSSAPELNDRG